MLAAARESGMQVVWDLCHYGLPHDVDIWSADFVDRYAAFAGAAAWIVRQESNAVPVWCPMNETSFWAWAGGDQGWLFPHAKGRGNELKRQLVRATLAAMGAVRRVDPRARFLHAEPLIYITAHPNRPEHRELAEAYRLAQYQVWDMLRGSLAPELGGAPEYLDIIGVNYYFNNQWVHEFETMGMGHRLYRPLHELLSEVHARYGRPLTISETGAEGANGPGWLRYIGAEVRTALRRGIPLEGVCIYPVMDYPGWDNARHCSCGLIQLTDDYTARSVDPEMLLALQDEAESYRVAKVLAFRPGIAAE